MHTQIVASLVTIVVAEIVPGITVGWHDAAVAAVWDCYYKGCDR